LVLGLSECGGGQCLRLAKTLDAGRQWAWVASENLSSISTGDTWDLRFADALDGWISGPLLLSTHNGGRTWVPIPLPGLGTADGRVGALETADGRVFAEIAEGTDQNTYGPVVLFSSQISRDSWSPVPHVATGPAGYPGEISIAQGTIWVMLHPAVVTQQGNEVLSGLYRSTNGVSWRSSPIPCPASTVAGVAAATSTRVYIVCAGGGAAGSQEKTAYVSSDGGVSYRRIGDPPFSGDYEEAAASPLGLAVGAASGATGIDTTFNNGGTWTGTAMPGSGGGLPLTDLGFTTATQGVVVMGEVEYPSSLALFMTRNGGRDWAQVHVVPG
jgi:hypothetical protein